MQRLLKKHAFNGFNTRRINRLRRPLVLCTPNGLSSPCSQHTSAVLQVEPKSSWSGSLLKLTYQREGGDGSAGLVLSNRPHRFSWLTTVEEFMKHRPHFITYTLIGFRKKFGKRILFTVGSFTIHKLISSRLK